MEMGQGPGSSSVTTVHHQRCEEPLLRIPTTPGGATIPILRAMSIFWSSAVTGGSSPLHQHAHLGGERQEKNRNMRKPKWKVAQIPVLVALEEVSAGSPQQPDRSAPITCGCRSTNTPKRRSNSTRRRFDAEPPTVAPRFDRQRAETSLYRGRPAGSPRRRASGASPVTTPWKRHDRESGPSVGGGSGAFLSPPLCEFDSSRRRLCPVSRKTAGASRGKSRARLPAESGSPALRATSGKWHMSTCLCGRWTERELTPFHPFLRFPRRRRG